MFSIVASLYSSNQTEHTTLRYEALCIHVQPSFVNWHLSTAVNNTLMTNKLENQEQIKVVREEGSVVRG